MHGAKNIKYFKAKISILMAFNSKLVWNKDEIIYLYRL